MPLILILHPDQFPGYNARHIYRVNNVGLPGIPIHVTVSLIRKSEGLVDQLPVPGFVTPVKIVGKQAVFCLDTADIISGEYLGPGLNHQFLPAKK